MTEKMTFREHIVQDLGVCPQGIDPDAPGDITIYPFPGWDFGKPGPITVPRQDAIRPDGFNPRSQNGEGEGHFCTRTCETNDVHVGKMDITAEAKDTIAMYAAPAKTATVSVSAGYTGTLSGAHELVVTYSECTECGKIEDEKTPYTAEIEVAWTATAAGKTVECSTWTGPMTKGKGHPIHFAVNATCTACGKTAGSDAAALADVYELSIDKYDEYLGLNLTDAMKGKYVTRTATAKIDPEPDGKAFSWTDCGRCKWRSATDRATVTYGATEKTGPSSSYRAEPLTVGATVTKGDLSASANCTTNFTVVKVDVKLGDWIERADEKNGEMISSFVERGPDAMFGGYPTLAEDEMMKYPVSIGVLPKSLPNEEGITFEFCDNDLITDVNRTITGVDHKVSEHHYTLGEVANQKFYLFDGTGSSGKKKFSALHDNSAAHDMITYDACCCVFAVFADCTSSITGHSFWKIEVDESHLKLLPDHLRPYVGVYGFYPAQIGGDKTESYYLAPGQLRKDDFLYREHFVDQAQTSRTAHHVWHISFRRCIDGLEEVHSIASKKPKYDLSNYNCTDVAISVGRACGVPLQDAGFPDFSLFEIIREVIGDDENWTNDRDGSFSSPLGLLVNLKYNNFLYGVIE